MVTWFVSHYWGTPFPEFVRSLSKHSEALHLEPAEASYWICTFGLNQWSLLQELGGQIKESSFYLALESQTCRGTSMVIDQQAAPLERVWCLFEVAITYERAGQDPDFAGLLLCTESGVLNKGTADMDVGIQIAQRLLKINLRNAQATKDEDKRKILDMVDRMEGGFKSVNHFVRTGVGNALLEMNSAFESDFDMMARTMKIASTTLERVLSVNWGSNATRVEDERATLFHAQSREVGCKSAVDERISTCCLELLDVPPGTPEEQTSPQNSESSDVVLKSWV